MAVALILTMSSLGLEADNSKTPLPGLTKPVTVTFDAHDIPTIAATDEASCYRAQGFIHAQFRFAQMDGMRRLSAGETAELFGKAAVKKDESLRLLRGRETARACVERLSDHEKMLLNAYTEGVNAGLASMDTPPIEYALLGISPRPWAREDCALVYLTMFHSLSRIGRLDSVFTEARRWLPKDVYEFLSTPICTADCPILPDAQPQQCPPIPGVESIDLRPISISATSFDELLDWSQRATAIGSNAWVVAGSRTADGRAILANDPHLQITAPVLWFRDRLQWPSVDWQGLSIPGIPGNVIGTNGFVAAGFTNTTGDFEDYAIIDVDPKDPNRYLTRDGSQPFTEQIETIVVRGKSPRTFTMRMTRWGPVAGMIVCDDGVERPWVHIWVGSRPESINFEVLQMAHARTIEDGVRIMGHWYGPSQNVLMADHKGHIAWVMSGWIPDRNGHDPRVPWRPATEGDPWQHPIRPDQRPMVIDPPSGVIVSANHRTVPLDQCAVFGYYWANPERACRIHAMLEASAELNEKRMLEMQLDTTLASLEPYRALALAAIPSDTADATLLHAREVLRDWNGHADIDQRAVALLSEFQSTIERRFSKAIAAWVKSTSGHDVKIRSVFDETWLRVVEARPPHWLPSGYSSWDAFLVSALEEALVKEPATEGWGERNRANFASPLADALPEMMRPQVSIDTGTQGGHHRAVRVQTPRAAASARLVVSPGHEDQAILETPGGQSGNPMSPHYRSLHQDWRDGVATPLQPGPTVRTLLLTPADAVVK